MIPKILKFSFLFFVFSLFAGGGTSNIFSAIDEPNTPRSVKNHMKSNIFASAANFNDGSGKIIFYVNPLKCLLKFYCINLFVAKKNKHNFFVHRHTSPSQ